jgi:amino acid transporter
MDACVGSDDFNKYCTALGDILKSVSDPSITLPVLDLNSTFLGLHLFENLSIKLLAALLIVLLTILNYKGVQFAEKLSSILTYAM